MRVNHLNLSMCLAAFGLLPLLAGCSSLLGRQPGTFEPAVQAELVRQRQAARAAAEAVPPAPDPHALAKRLRKGDALRRKGAYADAMWNYLQAHDLDGQDPAPIARIASLHLLSDRDRAEAMFRKLAAQHPESGATHTGLGLALIEGKDWPGAHAALERAVAESPRSPAAHSALGVCLDRLGDHPGARRAYRRATVLHPGFYEAWNNLGVSYLTTEEFAAAEDALRRASAQEDRDPAVFNNLGLALGRLERYDDALKAFRQAGPEQVARSNLGYVAYLNGSYDRAIAEYERALLVPGGQRLPVLRNLRAARRAGEKRDSLGESARR